MSQNYSRFDTRQLQHRIQSMIARGVVSNVNDALKMQALDVELEDGFRANRVEHWHPYGMSYHPKSGAEVLALALGGNRDHMVVMPGADRRFRIKNMAPGEFAIHDDQGQKVLFGRNSLDIESTMPINMTTSQPVTINAPRTNIGAGAATAVALCGGGCATKLFAE